MNVSIRQGYSVKENEIERLQELRKLAELGIVELRQDKVQYCKHCNAAHKVEGKFLREGRLTCLCTRTVLLSLAKIHVEYTISKINYNKIFQICQDELNQTPGILDCTFDEKQRCWICSYSGKTVPIFIAEISSYNQYIPEESNSDSCWLCFVLDWVAFKSNLNYYNEMHFVKIEDILSKVIRLSEKLDILTTQYSTNVSVELGKKFDTFVSLVSWQQFELFAKQFLDEIRNRALAVEKFMSFLSVRRNTIINSKVILLGGPANPDFVVLDLLDYLQCALKPEKFGEVKHYIDSELRLPKYGVSLIHAGTKSSTLCIVASNEVDPELWKYVLDVKKEEGYFKHVILERDTIVLLIKALGMEDLISKPEK